MINKARATIIACLLFAGLYAQVTVKQFNLAVPPSGDLQTQANFSLLAAPPPVTDEPAVIARTLAEYESLKKAGKKNIVINAPKTLPDTIYPTIQTGKYAQPPAISATGCNCWQTIDNTYSVVPFQF